MIIWSLLLGFECLVNGYLRDISGVISYHECAVPDYEYWVEERLTHPDIRERSNGSSQFREFVLLVDD